MVYLSLKQPKFKKIHMEIDVENKSQLDIEVTFSFKVKHSEDNSSCIAYLHQDLKEKNIPSQFNISVELLGYFSCDGIVTDYDKKISHIQSYILLFPYMQNMIAQLTSSAGMPPLMIEMIKMNPDDIIEENI